MWKNKTAWIILIVLGAGIKIFSLFPNAVERYYSNGIYRGISRAQRMVLGWIPFSIGDILYAIVFIFLVYKSFQFTKRLIKKNVNKQYITSALMKLVFLFLFVYVYFNLAWGLNYNRIGIKEQLALHETKYSSADLAEVMQQLVYKLNALHAPAIANRLPLGQKRNLFTESVTAYQIIGEKNKIYRYKSPAVKPSLYSYLGNYLGYTGYYNPFTGEAQVNTTVPVYIQPFVSCHEVGHQLGYAKESEASFAGYLSAKSSDNPAFQYSAYFDLYAYARRYLYLEDSMMLKQLDSQLNVGVKKDYRDLREFFLKHTNPIEKAIDILYGEYLKANEQPMGKVSYNEVVLWVIAYYKKYKTI